MFNFFSAATYTVKASHQEHFGNGRDENIYGKTKQGKLVSNDYLEYRFCVPKQCQEVNVTLKHCMTFDEAGCNGKYGFPELLISKTVPKPKVTDMAWLLGESSRRTIQLIPSDPSFDPGHYYVSVYGWCTPANQCPDIKTCGPCNLTDGLDFSLTVSATDISDDKCQQMMSGRPKINVCTGAGTALLPNIFIFVMALLQLEIFKN